MSRFISLDNPSSWHLGSFQSFDIVLPQPMHLVNKQGRAYPANQLFFYETDTGSPFFCEGLLMCFTLINPTTLRFVGGEPAFLTHMEDHLSQLSLEKYFNQWNWARAANYGFLFKVVDVMKDELIAANLVKV